MDEEDIADNHKINSFDNGQYKLYILAFMQDDRIESVTREEAMRRLQKDTQSCTQEIFFSQLPTMFDINEQLKIHPRAFIQLETKEKNEMLRVTMSLKNRTVLIKQIKNYNKREYRLTQDILKQYRFVFDNQIVNESVYIAQKLKVDSLDDFLLNGVAILANLGPFQINRLYSLFFCNFREDHLIELAVEFAKFDQVDNFTDFCAAGEFAVILVRKETKKKSIEEVKSTSLKQKQKLIVEEFMQNEHTKTVYLNKYKKLKDQSPLIGLTFTSPRTAATHYYKHGKDICKKENIEPSVKTYTDLVSEWTHGHTARHFWTQEGSHKRIIYRFSRNQSNYLIILLENIFTMDLKILTFFETD